LERRHAGAGHEARVDAVEDGHQVDGRGAEEGDGDGDKRYSGEGACCRHDRRASRSVMRVSQGGSL